MQYYCHNPSAKGFIYIHFVRDLREMDDNLSIKFPLEYDGQKVVKLCKRSEYADIQPPATAGK